MHIRICLFCWDLESGPKHRGSFSDNMACAKEDQQFGGDLNVVSHKIEAHILQNTKK